MSQYIIFYHIIRVFGLEDSVSIFTNFSAIVFKIYLEISAMLRYYDCIYPKQKTSVCKLM